MAIKVNKKIIFPLISLLIISLVAISIITSKYGLDEIIVSARNFPLGFLIAAFILYVLRWIVESLAFKTATSKYKRLSFSGCFKTTIITQFTNMITPFMSGGQPATLLMLSSLGLDGASAFSAMFIKSMMFQFFLSLSGFISLMISFNTLDNISRNAAIIGIIINLSIVMCIIIIGLSETIAKNIMRFFITLARTLRLFKPSDEVEKDIYDNISKFNRSFREFRNERKRLVFLFLLTGIQFTLLNLCAFIIINGFGDYMSVNVFSRVILINSSALIVPTPGNSGGAEGLYVIFMNSILPKKIMGAGILIWRLIVFYIPVIITGILSLIFTIMIFGSGKNSKKR